MSEPFEKLKYDSQVLGLVLGLLTPAVFFIIYYFVRFHYMSIFAYFRYMKLGGIFTPTLSLCVVPNLLVFFIFIWTKRDKSARGVLLATFLYAIAVGILKSIE